MYFKKSIFSGSILVLALGVAVLFWFTSKKEQTYQKSFIMLSADAKPSRTNLVFERAQEVGHAFFYGIISVPHMINEKMKVDFFLYENLGIEGSMTVFPGLVHGDHRCAISVYIAVDAQVHFNVIANEIYQLAFYDSLARKNYNVCALHRAHFIFDEQQWSFEHLVEAVSLLGSVHAFILLDAREWISQVHHYVHGDGVMRNNFKDDERTRRRCYGHEQLLIFKNNTAENYKLMNYISRKARYSPVAYEKIISDVLLQFLQQIKE